MMALPSRKKKLTIEDWGLLTYDLSFERQSRLVDNRIADRINDQLNFVEHFPVVTLGRSGGYSDLCISEKELDDYEGQLCFTDRGGKATYHGPGQLVVYPIIKLQQRDIHLYVEALLDVTAEVLRAFGLKPVRKEGQPGLWVDGAKIASIGIAVKRWVTYHGVALNVRPDLQAFDWIVPCGQPDEVVTSMEKTLGRTIHLESVKAAFSEQFKREFGYSEDEPNGHPVWLKLGSPNQGVLKRMERLLEDHGLATVCQAAQCPNLGECFNRGTATFMILGGTCTRNCHYCAVQTGMPAPPDPDEPEQVANVAKKLGLKYVVVTSVTRDDLTDGGAAHFSRTIAAIRQRCPEVLVEVLVPDFNGNVDALETLCLAAPDMFNHNIETVPRLYSMIRPKANFGRSLELLRMAAQKDLTVKSGMMLGLGETRDEVTNTLQCLRDSGCNHLTLGQYLAPSKAHYPVARYVSPAEFDEWAETGKKLGFLEISSGPLVRSSYHADEHFIALKTKNRSFHETC
jgi:lipoyl synthase